MRSLSIFASLTPFLSSSPTPPASASVLNYISQCPAFDPNHADNKALLTTSTDMLKTKLAELQGLDKHIIAGFALGTTAFTLSSLLPFGVTMAISGFGYSAYCIGKREQLALEYRVALSDAIECLKWALLTVTNVGENDEDNAKHTQERLKCEEIHALFDILSPLMDEQQIRDAIDDGIESIFVQQADGKTLDLFGRTLDKQEKALVYGIYGYEQGSILDVGKGLWYLVCQTVNWIIQSIKGLWSHQTAPVASVSRDLAEDEEELQNISPATGL